jgi:hypothetical protein
MVSELADPVTDVILRLILKLIECGTDSRVLQEIGEAAKKLKVIMFTEIVLTTSRQPERRQHSLAGPSIRNLAVQNLPQ